MDRLSFDTHDRLDRKEYADFLQHLVLNSDAYRRVHESRSYSIALDSSYGTGKSFFLQMLCSDCERDTSEIATVYYNAWQHDLSKDPLSPLILTVLDHPLFSTVDSEGRQTKLTAQIQEVAPPILKAVAKHAIKRLIGEEVAEMVQAAMAGVEKIKEKDASFDQLTGEYKTQEKNITLFEKLLGDCVAASPKHKKLLVIIDELDRCKPLFAIETLEIVKHLMNAENVVFLFAVDIAQLHQSVKRVYGDGMDSEGYLRKFFDFSTRFPVDSLASFLDNLLDDAYFISGEVRDFFLQAAHTFRLSLRSAEIIYQCYRIMFQHLLTHYELPDAHEMYITLLFLKYVEPMTYYKLLHEKLPMPDSANTALRNAIELCDSLRFIDNSTSIREEGESTLFRPSIRGFEELATVYITYDPLCSSSESNPFPCVQEKGKPTRSSFSPRELQDCCINRVFFPHDLIHWDKVLGKTPGQYLHKQLEFFNFAQPLDVEKTSEE